MNNSYITKGLVLTLLAGSLSFGCTNKSKEISYIKYDTKQVTQEQTQNKNLEQKMDILKPSIDENKDSVRYHIIQKGDTYDKLAEIYWGTDKEADEIEKLNPEINYKELKIGQKIRVK